jgi:hypothetical protein
VQNVYIRKIEKVNGEPWPVEFATFEAVKDALKEAAAQWFVSAHGSVSQ